jgi:uncharacterized protein
MTDEQVITQTQNWIKTIVVGMNFCPFASRVVKQDSIRYVVERKVSVYAAKNTVLEECKILDKNPAISTTLIIFPEGFADFNEYLQLVAEAEKMMRQKRYDGVYQLATFHPLYQFGDTTFEDPANYTNRSVYPMVHLLREEDVTQALKFYAEPEQIPERNMRLAREKGEVYMKMLRESCF